MRCVTKTMLWALCGANQGLPQTHADEHRENHERAEAAPEMAAPAALPEELRGKRCVTRSMGWILFADDRPAMLEAVAENSLPPIYTDERGSGRETPQTNHKVPPPYFHPVHATSACSGAPVSRALPIHAKPGREWEPEYARSLNGRRDDVALVGVDRVGEVGIVESGSATLATNLNLHFSNLHFSKRVIPGRALMGAPLRLDSRVPHGLVREPVNESGVVFLFGMVAHLLGFDVEAVQGAYPDGEGKLEVEPGRWQNVRFEFEYESRMFPQHRHDAKKCDVIVCWKHNWKGCPEEIQVVELRRILRSGDPV